jgi:uncharacterized membrane protein YedE/YeeE
MNGPFYSIGWIGEEASLAIALIIGIAFGFFLERAGLGSAKKLSAQFYLKDLTVFKMMFTAIITAMIGVYWLNWAGLINAELIYMTPTFVWPQLIGGLVFGVGFIIGGYCPGTSCVASATGSINGVVNVLGIFSGILLFGELYTFIESFYNAVAMGQIDMAEYFGFREGIMIALLVTLALAGFWASEKLENKFG